MFVPAVQIRTEGTSTMRNEKIGAVFCFLCICLGILLPKGAYLFIPALAAGLWLSSRTRRETRKESFCAYFAAGVFIVFLMFVQSFLWRKNTPLAPTPIERLLYILSPQLLACVFLWVVEQAKQAREKRQAPPAPGDGR